MLLSRSSSSACFLRCRLSYVRLGPQRCYAIPAGSPSGSGPTSKGNLAWSLLGAFGVVSIAAGLYYPFRSTLPNRLSPIQFVYLTIAKIEKVDDQTSIFTLDIPQDLRPHPAEHVVDAPIQSVYLKQEDMQIQRPYTPLDIQPLQRGNSSQLELLVKRYDDGEMSKSLHRLSVGDDVPVRGPIQTWKFDPQIEHIVFIAGGTGKSSFPIRNSLKGTGITPFVQLLRWLDSQPPSYKKPEITLLYASANPETLNLKSELEILAQKYTSPISLHYFVDARHKSSQLGANTTAARIDYSAMQKLLPQDEKNATILVCGPEGMVEAIAGSRLLKRQHKVGGILGQLEWPAEKVVRL